MMNVITLRQFHTKFRNPADSSMKIHENEMNNARLGNLCRIWVLLETGGIEEKRTRKDDGGWKIGFAS